MRMNLVFTSMIMLFVGCNSHENMKKTADINISHNDSCSMKEETSVYSKNIGSNIIIEHNDTCCGKDNIKLYRRFQTFNEYRMKGVGTAMKKPYVLVRNVGDSIIHVRISNDIDSIICYKKKKDYWFNYISYDLWKKYDSVSKNGESVWGEGPAQEFFRFITPDAIIEYSIAYFEGDGIATIYKWTRKDLIAFFVDGFIDDMPRKTIPELYREIKGKVDSISNGSYKNAINPYPKRQFSIFRKTTKKNNIIYRTTDGIMWVFKLNSLEEYSKIPGAYKGTDSFELTDPEQYE